MDFAVVNESAQENFSVVIGREIVSEEPPAIEKLSEFLVDREIAVIMDISTFLIGIILIFILMLMTKRKQLCPACLNGHYALILPVNFLEEREKRKVFVAVFAIITLDVLGMVTTNQEMSGSLPPYAKIILKMLLVAEISVKYLALFRCIHVTSIVAYIMGLIYLILTIASSIVTNTPNPELPAEKLIDGLILRSIIIIIAGIYVIYWFVMQIVKLIKCRSSTSKNENYELTYVKNILRSRHRPLVDLHVVSLKQKPKWSTFRNWFRKNIYFSVPGFKYSLTILVSLTVGFIGVTKAASKLAVVTVKLHHSFSTHWEYMAKQESFKIPNFVTGIIKRFFNYVEVSEDDVEEIDFYAVIKAQMVVFLVAMLLAVFLSYILSIVLVCRMLVSYRQNVLNLYRRKTDQDVLNVSSVSNINLVISGIQYAGYQVAYLIAGYSIQVIFLFVIFLILFEIIMLPIQFAFKTFLKVILHLILPIAIALILISGTQHLLVRFAFLKNRGKILALDNRRGFFITMYIVFFYNVFTGFFSCFKRILKSAAVGIIMISRLDGSLFPKWFAKYDSGFKSYSCLLHLEELQCNPVLRTFLYILFKTNAVDANFSHNFCDEYIPLMKKTTKKKKRLMVARNRWFVALTLLRNPILVYERKVYLLSLARKNDEVKTLIYNNSDSERETIV